MKNLLKIFYSFLIIALISSCGVDKLKPIIKSNQSSLTTENRECSCLSNYAPVCDINGKTYDNVCIALCFSAVLAHKGNCQCSDTLKVCGVGLRDLTECEAIKNNIEIEQFTPCGSTSL